MPSHMKLITLALIALVSMLAVLAVADGVYDMADGTSGKLTITNEGNDTFRVRQLTFTYDSACTNTMTIGRVASSTDFQLTSSAVTNADTSTVDLGDDFYLAPGQVMYITAGTEAVGTNCVVYVDTDEDEKQ